MSGVAANVAKTAHPFVRKMIEASSDNAKNTIKIKISQVVVGSP